MAYETLAGHRQDGHSRRQSGDESCGVILDWKLKLRLVPFFFCLLANFVVTSFFVIGWAQEHSGNTSKEQSAGLMTFCVIVWVIWTVFFIVCYSFPKPWRQREWSALRYLCSTCARSQGKPSNEVSRALPVQKRWDEETGFEFPANVIADPDQPVEDERHTTLALRYDYQAHHTEANQAHHTEAKDLQFMAYTAVELENTVPSRPAGPSVAQEPEAEEPRIPLSMVPPNP